MNLNRKLFTAVIAVVCLASQLAAAMRIAIVAKPGAHKENIDMLTERLSKYADVHMLERVDIDYLIREHILNDMGGVTGKGFKIGKLNGANGLLIFSDLKVDGKHYFCLRLVSAKSGLIIKTLIYPVSAQNDETQSWVTDASKRFHSLFAKLTLPSSNLVPVSILNFRSVSPSSQITKLEGVVPRLLAILLELDEKTIVTERWDAWKVSFEKELGNDVATIQTGRVLIDGEIEEVGGNLTISLRINKPGDKKPLTISATGKKDVLPTLIKKLAVKTVIALRPEADSAVWSSEAEAKRFYEDAKWAYDFGKLKQAQESADAALALGLNTFELALLRIRILAGTHFVIGDVDYRRTHYTNVFQTNLKKINHPELILFNACKASDILAETRRKLLLANYSDSWKNRRNRTEFDRLERNMLVFNTRVIKCALNDGIQHKAAYSDTLRLLQLKTIQLFRHITTRSSWEENTRNALNHKYQAYMLFFGMGVVWYSQFKDWLRYFDQLLRKSDLGNDCRLIRVSLAKGRIRFENRTDRQRYPWPFQEKFFKYKENAELIKNNRKVLKKYLKGRESLKDSISQLDNCILEDFTKGDIKQRGLIIFRYLEEHLNNSKLNSSEYKLCEIAADMLDQSFAIDASRISTKARKHIISYCLKHIDDTGDLHGKILKSILLRIWYKCDKNDCESIISHIDDYRRGHPQCNSSLLQISHEFRHRFKKLANVKLKSKQIIDVPKIDSHPEIKLIEISPILRKSEIYAFKSFNDNILLAGVAGELGRKIIRLKNGGRRRISQKRPFLILFDKNLTSRQLFFIPPSIGNIKVFPEPKNPRNQFWISENHGIGNTLIFNDNNHEICLINRFGDIFTYRSISKKWTLRDSLRLNVVTCAEKVGNKCYIAFAGRDNVFTSEKNATGIMEYDLESQEKKVVFNNHRLNTQFDIERERGFYIYNINSLSDGRLILSSLKWKGGERNHYLFNPQKNSINKISQTTSMSCTTCFGKPLMYDYMKYISNFNTLKYCVDNDKYSYFPNKSHKYHQWQFNLSSSDTFYRNRTSRGMGFNMPSGILTFNAEVGLNKKQVSLGDHLYSLHYWRHESDKDKIIYVKLFPDASPLTWRLHFACVTQNHILIAGDLNNKSLGNMCDYAIWKIPIRKIENYYKRKVDYPRIFPYGWGWYAYEKQLSFWKRQRIEMENLAEDVEVRYTMNGSWPTEKSKLYKKPFVIDRSVRITARAFKKGMYSSDPFSVSYSKTKPKCYLVGDFDHDGKDEVLAHVGNLLKSQENDDGVCETVINTKAYGSFFAVKGPDGACDHIGYRYGNNIFIAETMKPLKYTKTAYPAKYKKLRFLAGDFNGDGTTDAMFADGGRLELDTDHNGKIDKIITLDPPIAKYAELATADWNGDGKDDILIKTGTTLAVDTDIDGKPDEQHTLAPPAKNAKLVIGDWNGDAKQMIKWVK